MRIKRLHVFQPRWFRAEGHLDFLFRLGQQLGSESSLIVWFGPLCTIQVGLTKGKELNNVYICVHAYTIEWIIFLS